MYTAVQIKTIKTFSQQAPPPPPTPSECRLGRLVRRDSTSNAWLKQREFVCFRRLNDCGLRRSSGQVTTVLCRSAYLYTAVLLCSHPPHGQQLTPSCYSYHNGQILSGWLACVALV